MLLRILVVIPPLTPRSFIWGNDTIVLYGVECGWVVSDYMSWSCFVFMGVFPERWRLVVLISFASFVGFMGGRRKKLSSKSLLPCSLPNQVATPPFP